jgi:hypothetical protein
VDAGGRLWAKGWRFKQLPPEEFELIACRAIASLQADGLPLAMSLAEASTNANAKLSTLAATVLLSQAQRWSHLFFEDEKELLIERLDKAIPELIIQPNGATNWDSERIALLQTAYRCLSRPASVKELVFSLLYSGYNPRARLRALQILSRRGEGLQEVQSLLVDGLSSSDPMLAENAAICIESFGARASDLLGQLEKALEHPDGNVRREASNAIAHIKMELSEL